MAVPLTGAPAIASPLPEQAELAERLLQAGQRFAATPENARLAAALADAADRLFENDPRLLRGAIDLRLSLGQRDKAVALLNAYRRLDPGDQIAQVQLIDLLQSKMESATARADYLTRVAGSDKVPAEVRAHASVLLANVETERGRDDAANAAVDQALALNGLNPKALQMKADRVFAGGDTPQRAGALVKILLADPMQFATVSRLAEELLRAGANEAALDLYRRFFEAIDAADFGPGVEDAVNYATLLATAGQAREAGDVAAAALKDHPGEARLQWLRVLLARQAGDEAAAKTAAADARGAALKNLMGLHAGFDAGAPRLDDATVPTLPDVKAGITAVQAKGDARLTDAYLRALGDLAWVDVYFGRRLPDAAVVEGIDTLAGAESPLAHRLRGFGALATGKSDEAEVALSAVAAKDPLSQLGLLALRLAKGQDKAAVANEGSALLAKLPTGVWPLTVRQTLKDAGPLGFRAADADAVIAAAELPNDWLGFAARGRSHYLVSANPIKGNLVIGEPMIARVTLQNVGDRPLAIGPGGAVAQQVAIDATVRSNADQAFPGVAVAKMTGRLVLRPRESTRCDVRVDSPELEAFASASPQSAASVFVSAIANPVQKQEGIGPGPGGQRNQSRGIFDRPQVAFTRPETRQQLEQQLADPSALKRLHAVAALAACAAWANAAGEETRALVPLAIPLLTRAADNDASPTVRSLARQELTSLADEKSRVRLLAVMLASKDFESRVLGCAAMIARPKAERETTLRPLAGDADPAIAAMADAIAALPEAKPATPADAASAPPPPSPSTPSPSP